jgi:hypothetical protein
VGARLFEALDRAARAAGVDGVLTLATSIEVFLHHHALEKHGFVEVARHGDTRLLERRYSDAPSRARLVPDRPPPPRGGTLPVVVRHDHSCPLMLHVRAQLAAAARALAPAVTVDEAEATVDEPVGIRIAGRALPHAPAAPEALAAALAEEAARQV